MLAGMAVVGLATLGLLLTQPGLLPYLAQPAAAAANNKTNGTISEKTFILSILSIKEYHHLLDRLVGHEKNTRIYNYLLPAKPCHAHGQTFPPLDPKV